MTYGTRFASQILGGPLVETRVGYYSEDPYAIHIEFAHEDGKVVEWSFARDLMVQGIASPRFVGEGDVRLRRGRGDETGNPAAYIEDADHVEVVLSTPDGEAVVLMPLRELSRFVGRTLVEMPLGDELMSDEALLADLAR